ncbi:lactonase family protein [bacterium]|nr:MAG: lactonase family protein [bacterium]
MLLPLLLTVTAARTVDFYIGTYTSKEGSRGIYRAQLNGETGEISKPELAVEAENPSYVAMRKDRLYAVHEAQKGEVSAYQIEKDGTLTHLNTQLSSGDGPCFVSVDPKGKNVLVASYGQGALAVLPIVKDGSLAPASQVIQNKGSGPNKGRQEGPHLHSIYADAKARFVYACDLGTDEVLVYRFDPAKGTLTAEPSAKVPAGGGPRHLAFGKVGKVVYANNEMGDAVTVFAVDEKSGALKELQTISTLPEGHNGSNTTAAIVVHPNGKWLYVSNRGHESIAVYAIGHDGTLKLVEIAASGVRIPRGFDIDPSGKWLVAAGQSSNDLVSLAIDPKTGKLAPSGHRVALEKPVCVVFRR